MVWWQVGKGEMGGGPNDGFAHPVLELTGKCPSDAVLLFFAYDYRFPRFTLRRTSAVWLFG